MALNYKSDFCESNTALCTKLFIVYNLFVHCSFAQYCILFDFFITTVINETINNVVCVSIAPGYISINDAEEYFGLDI